MGSRGSSSSEVDSEEVPPVLASLVGRFPRLPAMLLLALAFGAVHLLHLQAAVPLSVVDELVHADYMIRSSEPDLVLDAADSLDQQTMREAACRRSYTGDIPPCGEERYDPAQFTWQGYNPAVSHPPVYYLLTGLVARAMRAVAGGGLITWGRVLGLGWTLAGCYVGLRLAESLGASRRAAVPALLAVSLAPAQLAAATMVNPDGASLVAGGMVALAGVEVDRGRWSWWTLAVSAFLAMALDAGNAVAVVTVIVFLLIRAVMSARNQMFGRAVGVAAVGVGGLASVLGWGLLLGWFSAPRDTTGSPGDVAYSVSSLPGHLVIGPEAVFAVFPPLRSGFEAPAVQTLPIAFFSQCLAVLLVGGLIGLVFTRSIREPTTALALGVTTAMMVTAPLFVLRNFYLGGSYFPIPPRYGLSVLTILAASIAVLTRNRLGEGVIGLVAAGLMAVTILALV